MKLTNLTINKLKRAGFEGMDASLNVALFEYGLIWKQYKRNTKNHNKGEYLFYYGVDIDRAGNYNAFDWAAIRADVDPLKEWNWADFDAVCSYTGKDKESFLAMPLCDIVSDMLGYYGKENVFGGTYYSFTVKE
jgi:hypothetical protein